MEEFSPAKTYLSRQRINYSSLPQIVKAIVEKYYYRRKSDLRDIVSLEVIKNIPPADENGQRRNKEHKETKKRYNNNNNINLT